MMTIVMMTMTMQMGYGGDDYSSCIGMQASECVLRARAGYRMLSRSHSVVHLQQVRECCCNPAEILTPPPKPDALMQPRG